MSVTLGVITVPGAKIPRSIVERAFVSLVKNVHDDDWYPRLPTGEVTSAWMRVEQGETIDSFSINRPPDYEGFPRFWEAIFEVMRQTPTWCIIPGAGWERNCCVVQADLISKEMIEFAGGPERVKVASSAAELSTSAWA
ncbi:MAG: hypothetical protein ABSC92_02215 [Rhizomicrobium sp.]|jgi:hypothetical protein